MLIHAVLPPRPPDRWSPAALLATAKTGVVTTPSRSCSAAWWRGLAPDRRSPRISRYSVLLHHHGRRRICSLNDPAVCRHVPKNCAQHRRRTAHASDTSLGQGRRRGDRRHLGRVLSSRPHDGIRRRRARWDDPDLVAPGAPDLVRRPRRPAAGRSAGSMTRCSSDASSGASSVANVRVFDANPRWRRF